jgi:hypothetical protein
MIAARHLPESYQLVRRIDLREDRSLLIRLSLLSLILFLPAYGVFLTLGVVIHPEIQTFLQMISSATPVLQRIIAILSSLALFMLWHELLHGLFFWLFTHQVPKFGLSAAYAFAAAPGWYLARHPYLWIGIAPAILLSFFGAILFPLIPPAWCFVWAFGLAINLCGSVGDFYVVGWLLSRPDSALIQDHGDVILVFEPAQAGDHL